MKYTEEQEQYYTTVRAYTDNLEQGKTDIDTMLSWISNYKEPLSDDTLSTLDKVAEAYIGLQTDILLLLDMVRHDMREEYREIPEDDENQRISCENEP